MPTPDPDARDLREIDVQVVESEDYAPNTLGEIDRGDPRNDDGYYEPITFIAEAGDTINVTVYANTHGDPKIVLRAPNSSTLAIDDRGLGDSATIENETLPATGRYTVIATASEDSSTPTFTYRITVDRGAREGEFADETEGATETESLNKWFGGSASRWNETEQYAKYAYDFGARAQSNITDVEPRVMVNPEEDYIVMTLIGGTHLDRETRKESFAELGLTHVSLYEDYRNNSYPTLNDLWVPNRIYLRYVTPQDRSLYRVAVFNKESAMMAANRTNKSTKYDPVIDDFIFSMVSGAADRDANSTIANITAYPGIDREEEVVVPPLRREGIDRTMSLHNPTTNATSD